MDDHAAHQQSSGHGEPGQGHSHGHGDLRDHDHAHGDGDGHGDGHGQSDGALLDWNTRADDLEREGEVALPLTVQAVEWVAGLSAGRDVRQVVDAGSGPGVAATALAAAFAQADVLAVDAAPGLLARVTSRAARLGLADRVRTLELSLDGDLHELCEADVIWASRVLHHVPDQPKALRALGSRLRPGGLLVLVEGGLPSRFLPDENGLAAPGLLARLDAAISSRVHTLLHHGGDSPVPRPVLDWPQQLAAAGLTPSGSRTFLLDLPAPIAPVVRDFLVDRVARMASLGAEHLSAADRDGLDRLLDEQNPLGVHQRPDLFLLAADTVHTARRP